MPPAPTPNFPEGDQARAQNSAAISLAKVLELLGNAIGPDGKLRISLDSIRLTDLNGFPSEYGPAGWLVVINETADGLAFKDSAYYLPSAALNSPGGAAGLDVNGKIYSSQLPSSVMEFKAMWDPVTNTPHLEDGVGNPGDVYRCTQDGTIDLGSGEIEFKEGELVIYSGQSNRWEWAGGGGGTGVATIIVSGAAPVDPGQGLMWFDTTTMCVKVFDGSEWKLSITTAALGLADVATSGSYDDLVDKPEIPDAQVQSDWNQSDDTAVDFIKNKPEIPDAQVQSDWNQADDTAVDFIKNKPEIPDAQIQSDWNQSDDTAVDFIKNKPIQAQSDWNQSDDTAVDFIKNKPEIPDAQIQSDWNQSDDTAVDFIKNKPNLSSLSGSIYATIEVVANKTYVLVLSATSSFHISAIKVATLAGSCTLDFKINGTSITGASAISASSVQSTATVSANVQAGDKLTMVVSGNLLATDLALTIVV